MPAPRDRTDPEWIAVIAAGVALGLILLAAIAGIAWYAYLHLHHLRP
jgi:uncharacterized membrane protein